MITIMMMMMNILHKLFTPQLFIFPSFYLLIPYTVIIGNSWILSILCIMFTYIVSIYEMYESLMKWLCIHLFLMSYHSAILFHFIIIMLHCRAEFKGNMCSRYLPNKMFFLLNGNIICLVNLFWYYITL